MKIHFPEQEKHKTSKRKMKKVLRKKWKIALKRKLTDARLIWELMVSVRLFPTEGSTGASGSNLELRLLGGFTGTDDCFGLLIPGGFEVGLFGLTPRMGEGHTVGLGCCIAESELTGNDFDVWFFQFSD